MSTRETGRRARRPRRISLNSLARGRERSRFVVELRGLAAELEIAVTTVAALRVKLLFPNRPNFTPTARLPVTEVLARIPTWSLVAELIARAELDRAQTSVLADALQERGHAGGELLARLLAGFPERPPGVAPGGSQDTNTPEESVS
jgi:hypothetical protein